MNKIRTIVLFLIMSCSVVLCSCVDKQENIKYEIPPKDTNIFELISKKYTVSELVEISNFEGSMRELDKLYPIECIRICEDRHRVVYAGNNYYAILYFDNSGEKKLGNLINATLSKATFTNINIGESLEYIKNIDPNGQYFFLYTGRNDLPRISNHYTIDGFIVSIYYNNNNIITDIQVELM